jgi:hypothetical protein
MEGRESVSLFLRRRDWAMATELFSGGQRADLPQRPCREEIWTTAGKGFSVFGAGANEVWPMWWSDGAGPGCSQQEVALILCKRTDASLLRRKGDGSFQIDNVFLWRRRGGWRGWAAWCCRAGFQVNYVGGRDESLQKD